MAVNKLEALVLGALFLAPCALILRECALAPSLFALHPAANAVAFLICFPAYVLRSCLLSRGYAALACYQSIVAINERTDLCCSSVYAMLVRKASSDAKTRYGSRTQTLCLLDVHVSLSP